MAAHWYFRSTTCKQDGSLGASMVEVESKIDHPEVLDPFWFEQQALSDARGEGLVGGPQGQGGGW